VGAVAVLGLPYSKGEQGGVTAPAAGRARRLAVWRSANRGDGCERGRGRRRASGSDKCRSGVRPAV